MQEVCRICRDATVALVNIFGEQTKPEDEPGLAEMISECTGCEVNAADPLPQQLCESCVLAAQSFYRFKRKCEESHQLFWQLLSAGEVLKSDDWPVAEWPINKTADERIHAEQEESLDIKFDSCEYTEPINVTADERIHAEQEESLDIKFASCEYTEQQENTSECYTVGQSKYDGFEECDISFKKGSSSSSSDVKFLPDCNNDSIDKKSYFTCITCGKGFISKRKLNMHERFHGLKRAYKCQLCPKEFVNPGNLADHVRAHTGERPYKCPHCVKAFTQRGRLNEHIRIHTGERPFKCVDCPKTFVTAGNLKVHKRIHTGKRQYKCAQCEAAYVQPGALQRHMRVHLTGERLFKCDICLMPFPSNSSLKRHMNSHSSPKADEN